jgi:OFA family oxalate/formate antiporter-like MFS transporter
MLFAGIIYAWSILKAPLAAEFHWTPAALALNFTIMMCFFCVGGVLSGIMTRGMGVKAPIITGGILTFLGFFLTSRMSGASTTVLYLSYGVLTGCGVGMAYNAVISGTMSWFPDKAGTCSGALMMGFGASTLVLGTVASSLIQSIGWRNTYVVLAVAIGAILVVTGLIIKLAPADAQFPKPTKTKAKRGEDFEPRDYTAAEMTRRSTFWRFFLYCILSAAIGNTVISAAKDISISVGAAAALATTLVGVLSICNGLGRILSGALFDAFGRRTTMLIANTITIAAPAVTLAAVLNSSIALCVVGLCLCGLSYGCAPTITSAVISSFYGPKNFSLNFSIANTFLIPTSFVATLAGSFVTKTGSFTSTFIMLLVFSIAALGFNLSIKRP